TSICIFSVAGALAWMISSGLALAIGYWPRIPPELAVEGRWMLALLGINLAVGLPLGVFPCVLDGLGRFPVKTFIRTGVLLLRLPVFLIIVYTGHGLIELALAITVSNLVEHLLMGIAARYYLPDLKFSLALADRKTFRTIRGYSVDAFLAMIAGRLSFQTD